MCKQIDIVLQNLECLMIIEFSVTLTVLIILHLVHTLKTNLHSVMFETKILKHLNHNIRTKGIKLQKPISTDKSEIIDT